MSEWERVRRQCQSRRQLYEDPDFPATQTSVFYHQSPPFTFAWLRPQVSYCHLEFNLSEDFHLHGLDHKLESL